MVRVIQRKDGKEFKFDTSLDRLSIVGVCTGDGGEKGFITHWHDYFIVTFINPAHTWGGAFDSMKGLTDFLFNHDYELFEFQSSRELASWLNSE